jgi:hypothetical protein
MRLPSNSVPVNTMAEFFDYAKRNPGKIAYGTGGIGTLKHLTAELIPSTAGIQMVHVPYKDGNQSLQDLVHRPHPAPICRGRHHHAPGECRQGEDARDEHGQALEGAPSVPTTREVPPGMTGRRRGWATSGLRGCLSRLRGGCTPRSWRG